jgi:acetyl esterase
VLAGGDMTWFLDHYCPDTASRTDPRIAVLLADDLRGVPPTYLASTTT